VAGNQSAQLEGWFAAEGWEVDYVASSARLGVSKPDPAFFEALVAAAACEPAEAAYVGDRMDLDVVPAKAAGMVAVHLRRGPWGYLQDASAAEVRVDSLGGLPEALGL
jgi:FMN phosphatase YigB (HAD superfamily)